MCLKTLKQDYGKIILILTKSKTKYSKKNIAVSFHIIVKALNVAVKIKFLRKWKSYILYCAPRCFNAAIDDIRRRE